MITIEDIKTMIKEETEKLNAIGLHPVQIKEVLIVKAISFYADARKNLGRIRVSYYYLEAPIDEIRATIMHELCHMVPEAGHGHGAEWKAVASKVNKAYPQYNIKRVGSNLSGTEKEFSLRRAASIADVQHKPKRMHLVVCNCCGTKFYRTKESNLTLHPEQYTCNCGGSLKRVC